MGSEAGQCRGEVGVCCGGATFLASLGSLVRWAPAQGRAGTIREVGRGAELPGGGAGGRPCTCTEGRGPVGPQGEGVMGDSSSPSVQVETRQCAGHSGARLGWGVHAGGSPWGH